MRHESFRTFLTAAVLAAMTALGGLGCLITGFSLPVEDPVRLTLLVAAVGTVCAALFLKRHGTFAVLCAAALAAYSCVQSFPVSCLWFTQSSRNFALIASADRLGAASLAAYLRFISACCCFRCFWFNPPRKS